MIDLRSDTVTQPCAGMRAAMAAAAVGDDVIDVDPTTARLQDRLAEMLGKECAMFMPSGTMTNQIAVRIHCQPGDEMLCEEGCHIYNYEQGGFAQLSAIIPRTIRGHYSQIGVEDLQDMIRPDNEHAVRTRLLCLENTHNRGGGVILPIDNVRSVCRWARDNQLATHLDGARLFNAIVATGVSAESWAQEFDTVSICLSKGLGAPVGSVLAGPKSLAVAMRRARKLFGGAMRQSGILAAAALYALDHNIERLTDDHASAQILAETIREQCDHFQLDPPRVDTNIVIFQVNIEGVTAADFCVRAKELGVWMMPFSRRHVRAVTHLHVTHDDAVLAAEKIQQIHDEFASQPVSQR